MLKQYRIFRSEIKKYHLQNVSSYFFRWLKSLKKEASSVNDERPWITFKAIDFLSQHLERSHKVFEYGGGGSTLFFLNRVAEVITVEHSREWFDILQKMIHKKGMKNWTGQFVSPEKVDLVLSPDISDPDHYTSDDDPSKGYNYKAYASVIDTYPDAYFDCVLVDGRSRPSCIKHALAKIRTGGYLVLDNSDRDYYLSRISKAIAADFKVEVDQFAPCPYLPDFTKTTIWKKIK